MNKVNKSAPKRERIIELVVSNKCCPKGIGKKLLNKMENYFKEVGCKKRELMFLLMMIMLKDFIKNGCFNRNIDDENLRDYYV